MKPCRRRELLRQTVDDETVVLHRRNRTAHCLTSEAANVLDRCDGKTTVKEIARLAQLDETIVSEVVEQLRRADLVTGAPLLRRGALAGGIAFVATLSVPRAAAAASCVPLLGSCTTRPCCPGLTCVLQTGGLRICL